MCTPHLSVARLVSSTRAEPGRYASVGFHKIQWPAAPDAVTPDASY
jgi:hypothetical protein